MWLGRDSSARIAAAALALLLLGGGGAGCALGANVLEVPLFFETVEDPQAEWTVFPALLSANKRYKDRDHERRYILWPLFKSVRDGPKRELHALGIQVYRRWTDHRGFPKTHVFAPPVFFGRMADEGAYLTVFPLGGTLRNQLGKDFGLLILPPLFLYLRDRTPAGIFRSYHAPWPLVNWVSGGGRSGFRVLPFYARYRRHDADGNLAYDRRWILWPFWQSLRNNINSPAGEQRMWFLLPFAGRSEGPRTSQWTVLWPFFRYFEYRGFGQGGPYWELRAPHPFFIIGRGRYRTRTDIWPFYGRKDRDIPLVSDEGRFSSFHRHFVMWPLWRFERQESPAHVDRKWFLLPFLWNYERERLDIEQRTRTFKLWPLLRFRRHRDGRVTVNLFSPLWFNDPEGAFERIYNPLTRLYELEENDEEQRIRMLWGIYSRRTDEETRRTQVNPLLYWNERALDRTERDVGVLLGLFRYIRRGDQKALRFFWLPEFPRWGGQGGEP